MYELVLLVVMGLNNNPGSAEVESLGPYDSLEVCERVLEEILEMKAHLVKIEGKCVKVD